MEEVWKDIPGYEGKYQVSNLGRVIGPRGKILKPWLTKGGKYAVFHLGLSKQMQVHQAVMLAFCGPPPLGMVVCHSDGNSLNNSLDNLRYDTIQHNTWDTYRTNHTNTQKIQAEDIRSIKDRVKAGEKIKNLAKEYGVDRCSIWRVYSGRTFKGVD